MIQSLTAAWYFDGRCTRHMTRNQSFFCELIECLFGHLMFGDGANCRIIVKENIVKQDLPCLKDAKYVEGLKANLISNYVIKAILLILARKNALRLILITMFLSVAPDR